jgi:hypothetical protein
MKDWSSVITHPLGLAAYALASVFGLLAAFGPTDKYPWLLPVAVTMACVTLVGGLALAFKGAYTQSTIEPSPAPKSAPSAKRKATPKPAPAAGITQHTKGDQSPNVADVGGHVDITYGESERKR